MASTPLCRPRSPYTYPSERHCMRLDDLPRFTDGAQAKGEGRPRVTHSRAVLAVLALGSNLGEPMGHLRAAALALRDHLEDLAVSPVYRSAPEGGADQPDYLNAVVAGGWRGTPQELLALARRLEAAAGRVRPFPGAPRTLDVDVIFLGSEIVQQPDLQVPHPRWSDRAFVLVPLLCVAPDLVDPVSGATVSQVAAGKGWTADTLERVMRARDLLTVEPE